MAMRLIDWSLIEFLPIITNSITNLFQMENFIIPFVKQGGDWSDQLDKFINNSLENKWRFLLPNH